MSGVEVTKGRGHVDAEVVPFQTVFLGRAHNYRGRGRSSSQYLVTIVFQESYTESNGKIYYMLLISKILNTVQ